MKIFYGNSILFLLLEVRIEIEYLSLTATHL